MKFKKHESGRSMVEMLGVLAIIGVLSVGGIAGYSLSMRRHRANGVVDLASKYALIVYNQCQQKVLNGELSTDTNNPDSIFCDTDVITFENAGIGNLPAGVSRIQDPAAEIGYGTKSDIVYFSIHFDDDKLCQATASIAGKTCNHATTPPFIEFRIKQN